MSHVFISYSKEHNKDYARRLAEYLRDQGFEVWLDDDRIPKGANWKDILYQAVQDCAACIVIMTPDAKKSRWIDREITWADNLEKQFFPLLLDGDIWPMFLPNQIENVHDGSLPKDDFLEALSEYAPRQAKRVLGAISDTPSTSVKPEKSQISHLPDILPPPFEWVEIPAGQVTLITEAGRRNNYIPRGQSQAFDVPTFAIAKYPVTNAQYAKFIEADGYYQEKWWTEVGWRWRETYGWTEPRFWDDSTWNGTDYPVVGVSWYEAIAFCRWLSEVGGKRATLPTDSQWQRASQDDDRRKYPWGNEEPNERLCNLGNMIGHTTPVTQYPAGASPYGVMDMSGNIWEWCLTIFQSGSTMTDGTEELVIRGGAWNSSQYGTRCVSRSCDDPRNRIFNLGFRMVCSAPN
jgi:formylglycine-generating enzyme required for sulfatase activity